MIERHFHVIRCRRDGFIARELELLNEIFMCDLGKTAALIRIQIYVIHVNGRSNYA